MICFICGLNFGTIITKTARGYDALICTTCHNKKGSQ